MNYIKQIKQKRIMELELSQAEVDERAGLSTNTMYKFEKGKIKNITIIEKIAKFFGGQIRIDFGGFCDELQM
jgi:DNA-binding XRE family transcriptional regulator